MGKIRLTMAQALLRFLDNQYVSVDGEKPNSFKAYGHFRSRQRDGYWRSAGDGARGV